MSDLIDLWERPQAEELYLIAGWRQWADAGSVSSGLPEYLVEQYKAKKIGKIRADNFYLFQVPATHDLVRPEVKFEEGYPVSLDTPHNDLYYAEDNGRGLVILIGDEPHMNIERYVQALLDLAAELHVRRMIAFGGVYGELPFDKERMVSCTYSLPGMKEEINGLAVTLSNYEGGASIGSYFCKRAGERDIEYVGFYAFVPTYDFSEISETASSIRIETDYMAWLAVMERVSFMLKLSFDLSQLGQRSQQLLKLMEEKVEEIDKSSPDLGVRDYLQRLSDEFNEMPFNPADEFWEEELRRLFDKYGDEEE